MASKRVTVFGGSGFLGRQIVKYLAAEGTSVRVAIRHPERASFLERFGRDGQIELVHADVWDETTVSYFAYYHQWRPHRSLEMDSPDGRSVYPPELGEIIEFPAVQGLHHTYIRKAA